MRGEELCAAYLAEIRRLYGDKIADKSTARYDKGWYKINVATEYPDGSVGTIAWSFTNLRQKQLTERLVNLMAREPKQRAG